MPPLFDQLGATIFYLALAGFGGFFGGVLTYAIGVIVYRKLTHKPTDNRISPAAFIAWCWGAALGWAMFAIYGKALLDVWAGR